MPAPTEINPIKPISGSSPAVFGRPLVPTGAGFEGAALA
jgi:hypothetical protein